MLLLSKDNTLFPKNPNAVWRKLYCIFYSGVAVIFPSLRSHWENNILPDHFQKSSALILLQREKNIFLFEKMAKARKLKINISKELGSVSALLLLPKDATALLVLSHGAGAGMEHSFMQTLANELARQKIASLRFNFLYMENGGGPDRPKKAHPAIKAAIQKALKYADGLTLLAGGKSFGGRMTSQVAALGELDLVKGIVYFGFPLHAPGKPGTERAAHLSDIKIPQLFLQGTRDTLANFELMEQVCKKLKKAKLVKMEGGDHSFKTLKKSGITHEEMIAQLAKETATFVAKLR